MRRLAQSIWEMVCRCIPSRPAATRFRRPVRPTLRLEVLEERAVMATASGVLTGIAFIDVNNNGILNQNEPRLPGIPVHLSGDVPNSDETINATVRTKGNGKYTFENVPAGTYTLSAGPG